MNAVFILSGLGILSLLAEIFNVRKVLFPIVMAGLAAAVVVLMVEWNTASSYYNDMLFFDNFAIAFGVMLSVAAILWFLMSKRYLEDNPHITEHFALALFALIGAVFMASYHNMVMLFLGIEILSVSLYVLAGSRMKDILSNEASFKYFIMGAFATGFLLFGIALVYGATGSFKLQEIRNVVAAGSFQFSELLYTGIIMILVGLAFKVSAAPFHFWTPDVYHGSPTAVTAFMSTIVKIAAFAAFFRLFSTCFSPVSGLWTGIIYGLSGLTLIIGNFTAIYQRSVKRLLAYSSIAHAGYLLIGLLSINTISNGTVLYYLAAYTVSTLGAFSVLFYITKENGSDDPDQFRGLAKSQPLLAFVMTTSVLSLAGIPPLAGFFAKYMILVQLVHNGHTTLLILAIAASLIAVGYYFRIIGTMFSPAEGHPMKITASAKVLMTLLVLLNIILSLFPGWLIALNN